MSDTGDKVLDHLPVFADVTPCQFDSDLRHHVFWHEKALSLIFNYSYSLSKRPIPYSLEQSLPLQ